MNALQKELREERKLRRARSREAEKFKSPVVRARETNQTTGYLPELEEFCSVVEKPEPIRADGLWPMAEDLVGHCLKTGGYRILEQQLWGRSHGRTKRVDYICWLPWEEKTKVVVEVKWFKAKGSWDKKVPDEADTLYRCIQSDQTGVKRAYVVLCGPGIDKMREDGWTNGRLDHGKTVRVIDFDFFLCSTWCWAL